MTCVGRELRGGGKDREETLADPCGMEPGSLVVMDVVAGEEETRRRRRGRRREEVVPWEEEEAAASTASAVSPCLGAFETRWTRRARQQALMAGVVLVRRFEADVATLAALACCCVRWRDEVDLVTEVMDEGADRLRLPDAPCHYISRLLMKPRLWKLQLRGVCIGEGGARNLLHALPYLQGLRSLVLSRTGMDAHFFSSLFSKLKTLHALQQLGVDHNFVSADACTQLAQLLAHSTSLADLNLEGCLIGVLAMQRLAEGIRASTSLARLNVSMCLLKGTGMASLSTALLVNETVTHLSIAFNASGKLGLSHLNQAMRNRKVPLKYLDIYYSTITDQVAADLAQTCVERGTSLGTARKRPTLFAEVSRAKLFIVECASPLGRFRIAASAVKALLKTEKAGNSPRGSGAPSPTRGERALEVEHDKGDQEVALAGSSPWQSPEKPDELYPERSSPRLL